MKKFITLMTVIQYLSSIFFFIGICAGQTICNSPAEVVLSCGIPLACQETCPNPNEPLSLCSDACVNECSCADGYVRNGIGGPCILRSDCPPIQKICRGPEEVHLNCSKPLSCQDYCNRNTNEPLLCLAICADECSCADGYIRETMGGPCILSSQCPSVQVCSSPQEVRLSCGKPLECQDYCNADGPITCTKNCVEGCSCADGYIRSTVGGPCVLISECLSN